MDDPEYTNDHLNGGWMSTVQGECLRVGRLCKLSIQVDGTTHGEGKGSSKKAADEDAAKQALIYLKVSFVPKTYCTTHWSLIHYSLSLPT